MHMRVLVVLTGLIAASAACSNQGYGTPTNPTPVASDPGSPSPTTGGGQVYQVPIPSGAANFGAKAFGTGPMTVPAGTTVTWTNTDSLPHTSTSDGGTWDSGTIAPGKSFSAVLSKTGTFQYHCTIHPGMLGTITVE
jgi:plastocyanin